MTDAAEIALNRATRAEERQAAMNENARKKRELLARLSRNEDFVTFMRTILEDLCAFDFGAKELTPFTQGIRAAASHVVQFIASTKEGAQIMTRLAADHFKAGVAPETTNTNEEA